MAAAMNGAVVTQSLPDLLDVETNEMAEFDVGDLALGLHLSEPAE